MFMKYMLAFILLLFSTTCFANSVNIAINNSYGVGVEIECKCDFNNKIQKYDYYHRFYISKRSAKTISVPSNLKNCEIWVLNVYIFSDGE
jgi:hypothetical protein